MTLPSPLNTLVRLLTTMSTAGRISTLTNVPIVSSTTMAKPYRSANERKRVKSADRSNGLEGNSVKSDRIGGSSAGSEASSFSRSSSSASVPWPK